MPAELPLTIIRGCTFEGAKVRCKDGAGEYSDFTGWSFEAQARQRLNTAVAVQLVVTPGAEAGEIIINPMTPEETMGLVTGEYPYDLVAIMPDGTRIPRPVIADVLRVININTRPAE